MTPVRWSAFVLAALCTGSLVVYSFIQSEDSWLVYALLFSLVAAYVAMGGKIEMFGAKLSTGERERATGELERASEVRGEQVDSKAVETISEARRPAGQRILWVDDHPEYNVHETAMFLSLGFDVTAAVSTEDAMELLRTGVFDLVLTDLRREDNAEAGIDLIRQMAGAKHDLPAFVYAGQEDERHHKALEAGARAVTYGPSQLLTAVVASR